jgi:hypothetical protein
MNYKLTTDLIADCMSLIPQYLELLNKNKNYDVRLKFKPNPNEFGVIISKTSWKTYVDWVLTEPDDYAKIHTNAQIIIDRFVQDCLRTIPEFQAENPSYSSKINIRSITRTGFLNTKMVAKLEKDKEFTNYNLDNFLFNDVKKLHLPKTIAFATLHGLERKVINGVEKLVIMDKPPSTLEELCESYKNVMSK